MSKYARIDCLEVPLNWLVIRIWYPYRAGVTMEMTRIKESRSCSFTRKPASKTLMTTYAVEITKDMSWLGVT